MLNIAPHTATPTPFPLAPVPPQSSLEESSTPVANPPLPTTNTYLAGQLADKENLKLLGLKLNQLATDLGNDATPEAVLAGLRTLSMNIHPGSSFPAQTGSVMPLGTVIESLGLQLPSSHFHLTALADAVLGRALEHPLGDLGGALSWPIPLSADEQRRLRLITMSHEHHLGDKPLVMQTSGGVLEFLRYRQPLPAHTQDNPVKILEALLNSPQAQLMGRELQQKMQGIASDASVTDYLLAAIAVQMDPESIATPHRNKIAGFDLASEAHWGKSASSIVEGLANHLSSTGKTSPGLAKVGAHLLLASRAPVFLIKDIPARVTYGSPAWVNLAIAAATIEANTPGKVANMTFAQIMLEAEQAGLADLEVTQRAQTCALLDWGVANGVIARKDDNAYTREELTALGDTYAARQKQIISASKALDTDIPTRKEMALAVLKERFGDLGELFEEKLISSSSQPRYFDGKGRGDRLTGKHSLLDIAMMDWARPGIFYSDDSRIPLQALNDNPHFGVADAFNQQFAQAIEQKKNALSTTFKHLIAQLPLEDRQNFEHGKVSFFKSSVYVKNRASHEKKYLPKEEKFLVSLLRDGVTTAYQVDSNNGIIKRVPTHWATPSLDPTPAGMTFETKEYLPTSSQPEARNEKPSSRQLPPDSFSSERTQLIADALVEHIDLDHSSVKAEAQGTTTFDVQAGRAKVVEEFLLNLVPFRSAIVNFSKGNYLDGITDLTMDVLGILSAGAATVGKVAKVATTLSSAVKALKVGQIIGSAVIGTLNPLSGVVDLAAGGAKLIGAGVSRTTNWLNNLRGASGSYDLLKAVSKQHGPSLMGTFKALGVETEGVAVLRNNRWYKYDQIANKPYGPPIEDFSPRGARLRAPQAGAAEPEQVKLYNILSGARSSQNLPAFNLGYRTGRLEMIAGYRQGMNSDQLKTLLMAPNRRPDELGTLSRELKRAYINDAEYLCAIFKQDVMAPGVSVAPVSQVYYNARVDLPSIGECAGMSSAMALAIHHGNEDTFLKNLMKVADDPSTVGAEKFVADLRNLQDKVGKSSEFHFGMQARMADSKEIIDKLTNFPTSTTLRIGTTDHAMLAGIKVEPGKTEWFFYDPNSGLAKFTTLKSMQDAMDKVLNSGQSAAMNKTRMSPTGERLYSISIFDPSDLNRPGIDADVVEKFSSVAL